MWLVYVPACLFAVVAVVLVWDTRRRPELRSERRALIRETEQHLAAAAGQFTHPTEETDQP
jgi:hypothetical protein